MNTSSILNELSDVALSNREAFLKEISTLPNPLGSVLVDRYHNRIARADGKPLLGEYAPWLLADLLPIHNREIIAKIALPWLSIYAYTYFIDDLIDQAQGDIAPELLVASGVLLSKGLGALYSLTPNGQDAVRYLCEQCVQTALATVEDVRRHRGCVQSFGRFEIDNLGRKASVLRMCAVALLLADGAKEIHHDDLRAIFGLETGVQLLDDVSDLQEDWRQNNYTYPLTLTLERLGEYGFDKESFRTDAPFDRVLAAAITTGALETTLTTICGYVEEVLAAPTAMHGSVGHRFLESVADHSHLLHGQVVLARQVLLEEKLFCMGAKWQEQLMQRTNVKQQLRRIRQNLQIYAQQS